ncbi:MAG: phosphatidylglycerol:prolipoprotein diacylglycerol transferase [Candidatus Woesearchaeota archaeon]|jgi:phosphatidylglycerol:prolipoprotein diacylglycerol transferase
MITLDLPIIFFGIPLHFLTEVLALTIGFWFFMYLRKGVKDTISFENRIIIITAAAVGAIIGARLLAALENPALFFDPPSLVYYISGKTIVGGLLGGWIAIEFIKKKVKVTKSSGDLFTFPIIAGIIIGRIGCFFTGVIDRTVGVASDLPWAMMQGDEVLRHPTSLYEILFLLIIWITLYTIKKRVHLKDGVLFLFMMGSYLLFRFLVEFIKPTNAILFGLSSIQIVSLIGVFVCLTWIWRKYHAK